MIAHSTGEYPGGVNPDEKPKPKNALKRTLSVVSSPPKSVKSQKFDTWYDDAQYPNWTPASKPAETVCETPVPSEAEELPATADGDMPPPPAPSGPEVKDALYWKFLCRNSGNQKPRTCWHLANPNYNQNDQILIYLYFNGFQEPIEIKPSDMILRLRRCCVVNGKKASAEAVKLFKTRDGRA